MIASGSRPFPAHCGMTMCLMTLIGHCNLSPRLAHANPKACAGIMRAKSSGNWDLWLSPDVDIDAVCNASSPSTVWRNTMKPFRCFSSRLVSS
jgi:hypothetical protein